MTVICECAKEFLRGYQQSEYKLRMYEKAIADIRERATRINAVLYPDRIQAGYNSDRIGDAAVMIADTEERMREEVSKAQSTLDQIITVIRRVPDEILQCILLARYVRFRTWGQIADDMCYEARSVYRLHNKALQEVDKILRGNGK